MNVTRADMADLVYFFAIARHQSFSKAAVELGVSASTLSHAIKGFEARLGVRLLNRTTKSVTLTAAGESLASAVSEPVAAIDGAIEQLNQFRDSPAGHIRLNVAVEAATLLLAPVLPVFAERYPDIELDIVASNRIVDVTEARFDAGIRYGGTGILTIFNSTAASAIVWETTAFINGSLNVAKSSSPSKYRRC